MHETDKSVTAPIITIIANGRPHVLPMGSTVTTLLNSFNITATYVVIQLDGVIIPRSDYASTVLQSDCKLEVITMVGGG